MIDRDDNHLYLILHGKNGGIKVKTEKVGHEKRTGIQVKRNLVAGITACYPVLEIAMPDEVAMNILLYCLFKRIERPGISY
jgi:hypothetical protein